MSRSAQWMLAAVVAAVAIFWFLSKRGQKISPVSHGQPPSSGSAWGRITASGLELAQGAADLWRSNREPPAVKSGIAADALYEGT